MALPAKHRAGLVAEALGWPKPKRLTHAIAAESRSVEIVWFESGSHRTALLQINLRPRLRAAVYALRYRIFTGWHDISLRRAEQLASVLGLANFATLEGRRAFRRRHPVFSCWSWDRIRGLPPPA